MPKTKTTEKSNTELQLLIRKRMKNSTGAAIDDETKKLVLQLQDNRKRQQDEWFEIGDGDGGSKEEPKRPEGKKDGETKKKKVNDAKKGNDEIPKRPPSAKKTEKKSSGKAKEISLEELQKEIIKRATGGDGDPPTNKELLKAIAELMAEDSAIGEALRKLVTPPSTPSERRAQREDALEAPGMRPRTQPEHFREGNEAHDNEETRPNEVKEKTLPSGRRPDRTNPRDRNVREIKPFTVEGILAGIEKLGRYRRELEHITKEEWARLLRSWYRDDPNFDPKNFSNDEKQAWETILTLWYRDETGFHYEHFVIVNERMYSESEFREEIRKQRKERERKREEQERRRREEERRRREREERERRERQERETRERRERERRERERRRRRRRL